MAVYSAVVSFGQLLEQLMDSHQFSSYDPSFKIQSFHQMICSLQTSIRTIFSSSIGARETAEILEIEIRDAIYEAQDAIEYFISRKSASFPLEEIIGKIDPITAKAKEHADLIISKKRARWAEGDTRIPPPRSGLIRESTRIVGQERDKLQLTDELLNEEDKLSVLPITGMGGTGKTTLARSIYDDPRIRSVFAFRAWVTVSQDNHVGDILATLLNSMESRGQKAGDRVYEGSDEQLKVLVHLNLYNNKYLIVIDDLWDLIVWDRLRNFFPDNKNGSRIIITTRISSVADRVGYGSRHTMGFLDEENSWILLCDKAFRGKSCPPHLERIGREIAQNCQGLPLSLSVIGGLLSQERQTEEYWRTIADDTNAAMVGKGEDARRVMSILSLSYNNLPCELKACFLYLGAFPEDSDIPLSKLSKLWIAEGFLVLSRPDKRLEEVAEEHLAQRNLITVSKVSSDGRIKTCRLHDSMRDLSVQISGKEKFFHSVKGKDLEQGAEYQRRVSIHRNILMCLEDVYHSTKTIQNARSLLFVGPHHDHPLPFCLTFDLLRVLDAFTLYFIEFPDELLQLIHLRYLSFTYNDDLPPQISQLHKLQVLMVRREPKIIFVGVSFLPDEIWEMSELRHLWFTETDFPALPPVMAVNRALLHNLQSLSNINADSCTREVLRNMPNLKKLGMWVEEPGVVDELKQLKAFKFTVLNPSPKKQVEFQPEIFFPPTLTKLSLSGSGLSWEDMGAIARLPDLQVLKLRELAFNGEEWCLDDKFKSLKYLLIEYLNFKIWEAESFHFPYLEQLILRHCHELEMIPGDLGYIGGLELIELVDCSLSAMESAERIVMEQEEYDNTRLKVQIYCSYEKI